MADMTPEFGEDAFPITLSPEYWAMVLAALEPAFRGSIEAIGELKKAGRTQATVTDEDRALAGPMIIRGIIVKEMAARGHMRKEADERAGIDHLLTNFQRLAKKQQRPATLSGRREAKKDWADLEAACRRTNTRNCSSGRFRSGWACPTTCPAPRLDVRDESPWSRAFRCTRTRASQVTTGRASSA